MGIEDPDIIERPKSNNARIILILGVMAPVAVGLGVGIGLMVFGPKKGAVAPVASASAMKCPPAAPAAPPEPVTLVDKAIAGDFQAIDELKGRTPEQRSVEETLALARGRSGNKARALEGFATEIKKNPDLLKDKDQLARLREFLNKAETTTQAAGVIASLPGTLGPDLLFEVANAKAKNDTTDLAEQLLAAKELRTKATPALNVALDLRKAEACEDFKPLLARAAEAGDRRSVPVLAKLTKKRGCGDNKLADCYECLRPLEKDKAAIDLTDAIKAASKRSAPKL